MLDVFAQIQKTEEQALSAKEIAHKKAQTLLDKAEHQGKSMVEQRRHEAHRKATHTITAAEEAMQEQLHKVDKDADNQAARIKMAGEKNINKAVSFIVESIMVAR